jgi:hypothetical protein
MKMSGYQGTYDPKKVNLIVDGVTISGFADGSFIKVARLDKELFKTHVGAHGEVGRTKNPNTAGKFTFTLLKESPSNVVLDAFKNLSAPIALALMDKSDAMIVAVATNAWISTDPDLDFAIDDMKVEWEITCDELNKSFLP